MKSKILREIHSAGKDYVIVRRSLLLSLLGEINDSKDALGNLDANDPDLYIEIRMIRKAHKISQTQLATEAKLRQPDVSAFEKGDDGFSSERKKRVIDSIRKLVNSNI